MSDREARDAAEAADRRAGLRHFTCYPFHIQRGDAGETADVEIALVQDLSAQGAFLLVRDSPPVGTRVKLHLDVFDSTDEVRVVVGHVVRTEARALEESDVWRTGVAVQFAERQDDLDEAAARLARAAAAR